MSKISLFWSFLFCTILFFTGLQNFYDLQAIMEGGALDLLSYEGPAFVKLLKDLVYVFIFLSSFFFLRRQEKPNLNPISFLIIFLIFNCFVISYLYNGLFLSMIGLRWCFPFLIFLLARPLVENVDPQAVIKVLLFGILICFLVQIYQIFNMPPIYGEILGGLPARTPGIFIAPNSAAFFACSSCALIMTLSENKDRVVISSIGITFLVSVLAQSGTGIICSILLLVYGIVGRFSVSFFLVGAFFSVLLFLNLDSLTMREDYVSASGGNRLDVFLKMLELAFTSFDGFGLYTNAAMLIASNAKLDFVLDSLWASWFGNFGVFAFPVLFLTILFCNKIVFERFWSGRQPVLLVFLIFSMTSIVFEAFPMNIYIIFGLWYSKGSTKII